MTTVAVPTATTAAAAAAAIPLADQQHIVLDEMSWEFYERLLEEIGDRHIRVTYDDGRLEIMSPLPKHERWGRRICNLLSAICIELRIKMVPLGSTTFRDEAKKKGLEPDECFYIAHADAAMKMEKAFDPKVDPPPDLAVEIDITRRSIARQPIYAALGVAELWRFDGRQLQVLILSGSGQYEPSDRSLSFPMLPLADLRRFLDRMRTENDSIVLGEIQQWIRSRPATSS